MPIFLFDSMKFKVIASKLQLHDPPRNPFLVPIDGFGRGTVIRSTFEVEADPECQVRKLWDQAQKDGYQCGFTIDMIVTDSPVDIRPGEAVKRWNKRRRVK